MKTVEMNIYQAPLEIRASSMTWFAGPVTTVRSLMMVLSLTVAFVAVGVCCGPQVVTNVLDAGYSDVAQPPPSDPSPTHPSPVLGPCGRRERTEFVHDGGILVFEVPLPCIPFDRDFGDPQP